MLCSELLSILSVSFVFTRQLSIGTTHITKVLLSAQKVLSPKVQELLLRGCQACCRESCGSSVPAWPTSTVPFSWVSQSITMGSEPNHSTEGVSRPHPTSIRPLLGTPSSAGTSSLLHPLRPGLADSPARLAQPRRELPGRRVEPLPVQSDAG